jgi:hypothetical protein
VLNDVIEELNTTLQAQTAAAKGGRGAKLSGIENPMYGMWNPQAGSKIDVLSLIPTLLIVGLGIMLLPIIITCFTQIVAPLTYANGRRKRDTLSQGFPFHPNLVMDLLSTFSSAMEKFGKL